MLDRGGMLTGLLVLLVVSCAHAFIAPQEIPSILSLVYSNIPPVKKGTDSRVGFGYRLGEHADFQVLFELGPQTNTKAIGEPFSTAGGGDTSKRNVNQQDYKKQPDYKNSPNPVGSKWLNNWSQDMRVQQQRRPPLQQLATGDGSAAQSQPIQTRPFIAEASLRQLQQLYGKPLPSSASASASGEPAAVGTLPAASMDALAAQLDKVRFGNSVRPKAEELPRNQAKITASLMDIDLS